MTKEEREQLKEEKMKLVITNKQGLQYRIKEYRSYHDIDIEFIADGAIRGHMGFNNFEQGLILHPDTLPTYKNRLGKESISKDGVLAKVIEYNSPQDFIIELPDRTIKHLSSWSKFINGNFYAAYTDHGKPSEYKKNERKQINIINTYGYNMKILNYKSNSDVDIIFDDGSIAYNQTYTRFTNGNIIHPKYKTLHINKLKLMQNHGIKDVIRYNNIKDFDVELETGEIIKNASYYQCTHEISKLYDELHLSPEEIENRKSICVTRNRHIAHVLNYRNCLDIDIQFEDGAIIENLTWNQFIKKNFSYPDKQNKINQAEQYIYKNYRHGANQRKIPFNLTKKDVLSLIHQPCYICGRTDVNQMNEKIYGKYRYNGIDRVDNTIGYEIENVKPCCQLCNRAKMNLSLDDFMTWVYLVSNNQFYKNYFS